MGKVEWGDVSVHHLFFSRFILSGWCAIYVKTGWLSTKEMHMVFRSSCRQGSCVVRGGRSSLLALRGQWVRFYTSKDRIRQIQASLRTNPQNLVRSQTPIRSVLFLVVGSIASTMALYTAAQLWQLHSSELLDATSKRVFLPIWVDFNLLYTSRLKFPQDLQYLDRELHDYVQTEIDQNGGDVAMARTVQDTNVRYRVLEKLSANRTVRKIFGVPLTIELAPQPDFQVWIEPKTPTVTGLELTFVKLVDAHILATMRWKILPVNVGAAIESALTLAGLKLDRLERTEANRKTHERASGKPHEVPITSPRDPYTLLNDDKDFNICFAGTFVLADKGAVIRYSGLIDFDHLMINRGIKLTSMGIESVQDGARVWYKVL